jgi:hypothetical protein
MVDTIFVNANDDKAVTKVELYINGSLSGTDETTPFRFIWDTEDWNDGDYVLQAKAYDAAGHSTTSASVTTTIRNAFPVTFINTTYTPMSITAYSVTRTVAADDSTTYTLSTNPRNLVFTGSTSGKTSGGSVIGLTLSWGGSSNPISVTSMTSVRIILQVPSTYFFMYMSNTGATLGPVYVNYGLSDQTVDNISIPSNGVKYSIGYYKAHSGAVVRAYRYPSTTSYVYWTLSFPFNVNQSLYLTNSLSKIASGSQPEVQSGSVVVQPLPSRLWKQAGSRLNSNSIVVLANE